MAELTGKVAVVSGAAGALGRAVARRLQQEQVRFALIDRNEAALNGLCQELGLTEETALIGVVDLTQKEAVDAFVARVVATFGSVDLLANIAGGFVFSGPVHKMNVADLDSMFSINVKTAFLLSAAVARQMVTAGTRGHIVNVSARAALTGQAGMAAYCASKAAILRLTESMALELKKNGITVNTVLPSTMDTPANRASMPDADFSKWVTPDSLADIITMLCSGTTRDISGAAIPVYGRA